MEYGLLLFVATGVSIGVLMAAYAWYCTRYLLFGERKLRKVLLVVCFYAVIVLALTLSGYILSLKLFESYNTSGGRMTFVLLWMVPFSITSVIGLVRIIKARTKN